MKIKTGTIIVIVLVAIVLALMCVLSHIVKVENIYTYDNGISSLVFGKTLVNVRTIESKPFGGEVLHDTTRSVYVDWTGEMLVGDGQAIEVSYALR